MAILPKNKFHYLNFLLFFSFVSLVLSFFLVSSSQTFAQECYVNIPAGQTLQSYCAQEGEANWDPNCALQGNTCPGTTQADGGGTRCWACVSNPPTTEESCRVSSRVTGQSCSSLGYNITNNGDGGVS